MSLPGEAGERRARGAFVFGFAMALLVALPVSLVGLRILADHVTSLLVGSMVALVVIGSLGVLLFLFRRRLFRGAIGDLPAVYAPLPEAVAAARSGRTADAFEAVERSAKQWVRWYGWVSLRGWIIRVMVALVAGFAALLGSVLLWEQNRLVTEQNALIAKQNAFFQEQIRQDSAQWYAVRRAELQARLVDVDCSRRSSGGPCPLRHGPMARAHALASLVALERSREPAVELVGLDLRALDLRFLDLSAVRFVECDLRGARLDHARLPEAQFARSRMAEVSLVGARVDQPQWIKAVRAQGATGLVAGEWTVCADRIQPTFPGCKGTLVEATVTALVAQGLATIGVASVDVAEAQIGPLEVVVNCSTPHQGTLRCELAVPGQTEVATTLHWGSARLTLEPQGRWPGVAIELPRTAYTQLNLGRFNRQ